MTAYTPLDQHCRICIRKENDTATGKLFLVVRQGQNTCEVELTNAILDELGYNAAYLYHERTGKNCFTPRPYFQLPFKVEDVPKAEPQTRVRVRTRT